MFFCTRRMRFWDQQPKYFRSISEKNFEHENFFQKFSATKFSARQLDCSFNNTGQKSYAEYSFDNNSPNIFHQSPKEPKNSEYLFRIRLKNVLRDTQSAILTTPDEYFSLRIKKTYKITIVFGITLQKFLWTRRLEFRQRRRILAENWKKPILLWIFQELYFPKICSGNLEVSFD